MRLGGLFVRAVKVALPGLAGMSLVLGGLALAGHDGNTLHACASNGTGTLRLVQSADDCRNAEAPVEWSVQGPRGEQGPGALSIDYERDAGFGSESIQIGENLRLDTLCTRGDFSLVLVATQEPLVVGVHGTRETPSMPSSIIEHLEVSEGGAVLELISLSSGFGGFTANIDRADGPPIGELSLSFHFRERDGEARCRLWGAFVEARTM